MFGGNDPNQLPPKPGEQSEFGQGFQKQGKFGDVGWTEEAREAARAARAAHAPTEEQKKLYPHAEGQARLHAPR